MARPAAARAGAPGWAELLLRLEFADAALKRFASLYRPDPFEGDDEEEDEYDGVVSSRFMPLKSRYQSTEPTA